MVIIALASARPKIAGVSAILALLSIVASLWTGERINFLIRACGGMLAAISWKPKLHRVVALLFFEGCALAFVVILTPRLLWRFFDNFISQIPIHDGSSYFRAMGPGILAFLEAPWLGVGVGNLRILCEQIIGGSDSFDCHPHPHNFYIQMLGETGILGLVAGLMFIGAIIWACAKPAFDDRSNLVVATMWIVPTAFFWPIASTADFFGQWNNIFCWSAIGTALAGARLSGQRKTNIKDLCKEANH